MIAPPLMRPSRNGACSSESLSRFWVSPAVSSTMIEKIMVVAPTTARPISTALGGHPVGGADARGADQHRLRGRLEGVAGPVVLLEQVLGRLEVHVEAVVLLELL